MGLIYKATNKINGKAYIGYTKTTLSKRIQNHKSDAKRKSFPFQNAILKYGIDGFNWEILKEDASIQDEVHFIQQYQTIKNGYNISLGGETGGSHLKGRTYENIHGKDKAKKLREIRSKAMTKNMTGREPWNKGKKCPQLVGNRKPISDETRAKMSASAKNRKRKTTV